MTDYSYWRNALVGKFGPVHDGDPQPGFYRVKNKGDWYEPVAIWMENGTAIALRSGRQVDAADIWSWVCDKPISEEVYRGVMAGAPWPDEIAPLSNNPPEGEAEVDEIQSAIDAALAELAKPVEDQAGCDRLANHRDRLSKLWNAQEKARKDEKQPHMDAAKAVDARFAPVLDRIKAAGDKLKAAITAFLLKEEQRRRRELAEQMKAQAADAPLPVVERPKAGTTGTRSMALRTTKRAVITDYAKALEHFKDAAEVREAVETLANRAARAGVPVPGVEVKEERSAA